MNKADLTKALAKKTGSARNLAEGLINALTLTIRSELSQGREVKIMGFGVFDTVMRKQRNGRNPRTGRDLVIPATLTPRFRPGKEFKAQVSP